jgi:hypothetical protein
LPGWALHYCPSGGGGNGFIHAIQQQAAVVAVRREVLDINPLYGADTYSGQFSKPVGAAASATGSSSYDLADFIFGLRARFS